jgi:hypothetical protein
MLCFCGKFCHFVHCAAPHAAAFSKNYRTRLASGAIPIALVARLTTPAVDVGTVYFTTLDNKVRKVRASS